MGGSHPDHRRLQRLTVADAAALMPARHRGGVRSRSGTAVRRLRTIEAGRLASGGEDVTDGRFEPRDALLQTADSQVDV